MQFGKNCKDFMAIYKAIIVITTLGLLPGPFQAATTLNFDSLPSAQGWIYRSAYNNALTPKETNAYRVDGTKLIQDTMRIGENAYYYSNTNISHLNLPFTSTARCRVVASEVLDPGASATAFYIQAHNGTESFGIHLNSSTIGV